MLLYVLALRALFQWERSTWPKTEAGKAKVSRNAYKGGTWRLLRELSRMLREQKKALIGTKTKATNST